MYNVSDAYKAAIEQPSRQFELGGEIRLKSGDVIPITDEIVRDEGDIVVETRAMSTDDETDIGACCAAVLTMTITDNNIEHLYADSEIELICSLILENGEKEPIPMGTFYVGANTAKRTGKRFSLTAYYSMIKLQYLLTDDMRTALKGMTGYQAAAYLYEGEMAQDEETVTAFPNGDMVLDFSSEQIETARDAVMWIGHLMGCFSRIDRLGRLEFVQLQPHNWGTDGTYLFIYPERTISPNQRFKTEFSDKKTQIFTLVMRDKDKKPVSYRANPSTKSKDTLISYETEQNPLVLGQSSRSIYDVLKNIISGSLHRMVIQTFTSEIANDPALEAGDYVTIQSGGDNDFGNFYSMITHNIWRYRGHHEIRSGASMQVVAFDQPVAEAFSARRAVEEKTYVQPISQSDKAARNSGGSISDRLIQGDREAIFSGFSLMCYDKNNKYYGNVSFDGTTGFFGLFTPESMIGFSGDNYFYIESKSLKFAIEDAGNVRVDFKNNDRPSIVISSQTKDFPSEIRFGGHKFEISYDGILRFDGKKVMLGE